MTSGTNPRYSMFASLTPGEKIGAVILAAGAGTRMGGVAKGLLETSENRTFLETIVATARKADVEAAAVVVGPPHVERLWDLLSKLGVGVIMNDHPERGMASSVAVGFEVLAHVRPDVRAAWLWPVDHPYVKPETLHTLLAALRSHAAVRPTYKGRRGHPPLIARSLFAQLAACADIEGGARTVLASADTIDVDVDDPGILRDIDTPADLEAR